MCCLGIHMYLIKLWRAKAKECEYTIQGRQLNGQKKGYSDVMALGRSVLYNMGAISHVWLLIKIR